MIQRIQTIWFLFGMACGVLLLYLPVWHASVMNTAGGMDEIGAYTHPFLLAFAPLLFLTHALSIFTYRKRKRQLMWSAISILLFFLFIVVALLVLETENHIFQNFHVEEFRVGIFLPVAGIIFNLLARRGIKKDEALIRSMDRLR